MKTQTHTHTSAPLFLFFLLRELVKWKVVEVQAIDATGQHNGQGVHDAGPLDHQLFPVAERGQHCQQVVPQLTRDENAEIGPHPCHNDGLKRNNCVSVCYHSKIRNSLLHVAEILLICGFNCPVIFTYSEEDTSQALGKRVFLLLIL